MVRLHRFFRIFDPRLGQDDLFIRNHVDDSFDPKTFTTIIDATSFPAKQGELVYIMQVSLNSRSRYLQIQMTIPLQYTEPWEYDPMGFRTLIDTHIMTFVGDDDHHMCRVPMLVPTYIHHQ
jgi:hypothetical protein